MQTRLPIEKHDVPINDVAFNDISNSQAICNSSAISELEILFEAATPSRHVVCSRMNVTAISYGFLQLINIMCSHPFWVGQDLGDTFRYRYLVNAQVWVR